MKDNNSGGKQTVTMIGAPATGATPAPELPTLTLFGLHKRSGKWIAVAVQTKGQTVVNTRVIETDPQKDHVRWCMEKQMHRLYDQGVDPFEEGEE